MDPKKQGIIFEALTYCALEDLGFQVHWGVKPKGFSIDPDFVLGPIESPTHWLLVTSTGSAKQFDLKFWRNLAEIFLAKRFFAEPPSLINLVFKQNQKEGLHDAMVKLCDADLSVTEHPFGDGIIRFVDELSSAFPANNQAKVTKLRALLNGDVAALHVYESFKNELKFALSKTRPELCGLWSLIQDADRKHVCRTARTTTVRRGIAKIMVLPSSLRPHFYEHVLDGKRLPRNLPPYLAELQFIRPRIGGPALADNEIRDVITLLGRQTIEDVIARSPLDKMKRWIEPLQQLGNIDVLAQYIVKSFSSLKTPQGMLHLMQATYSEPLFELDESGIVGKIDDVWIFWFLFNAGKAKAKKRQGFGLTELGQRAQEFLENEDYPPSHMIWRLDISKYANRLPVSLPRPVLLATASVLAALLEEIGIDFLEQASAVLKEMNIVSCLEQRLIPYRLFEPLPLLISQHLDQTKVDFSRVNRHPTFAGEYSANSKTVATADLITTQNTVIMWRSAPKNPRDKTKELASRVEALKFEYADGEFRKRKSISKAILVIDGNFTDEHLATLTEAGWDEIFYPDEMTKLKAAIV